MIIVFGKTFITTDLVSKNKFYTTHDLLGTNYNHKIRVFLVISL